MRVYIDMVANNTRVGGCAMETHAMELPLLYREYLQYLIRISIGGIVHERLMAKISKLILQQ